jgi:hypothetical protein
VGLGREEDRLGQARHHERQHKRNEHLDVAHARTRTRTRTRTGVSARRRGNTSA